MRGPTLRTRPLPQLLLGLTLMLLAAGCSEDDPTSPTDGPVVTDEITVTLNQINVVRDCDGGSGGEFAYKFYIDEYVDGELVRTHLTTDWNSFSANNNTAWDPDYSASFQLQRRPGVHFDVRVALRELDSIEHFMRGEFVKHDVTKDRPAWTPTRGNGDVGYDLYDSTKRYGEVEFLADIDAACEVSMTYSVSFAPVQP